jgi:Family of unknown function (DUF6093)
MVFRVATRYSRQYIARRALGAMVDRVSINRPGDVALNTSTGMNVAVAGEEVYQGLARIYSVTGPQVLDLGEADITLRMTYISIPSDYLPAPQKDDLITVLEARSDEALQGKVFRILDVDGGGLVRAVRRMQCVTWEESSSWRP